VDARLPDGSRVNAIIPPLAIRGPVLTIRKFSRQPFSLERLVTLKTLSQAMADLLARSWNCATVFSSPAEPARERRARSTLLAFGFPSGADHHDRGRSGAPAPAPAPHFARGASAEHRGRRGDHHPDAGAQRVAHAPRPNHRRRGPWREAFDMLQAMNTGHRGSMTRSRELCGRCTHTPRVDGADGRV